MIGKTYHMGEGNMIREPIIFSDLKKGIIVPKGYFEPWLERFDWTYHQLARKAEIIH